MPRYLLSSFYLVRHPLLVVRRRSTTVMKAAHPEVAEAAQLRAGDLVVEVGFRSGASRGVTVGMNQTGMSQAGNRVLLHAHLVQAEAVDDVLARQVHEHRPVDRQVQLIDRRDVVLRVRVAAIEAERIVGGHQLDVGPAELAVRPGIVDVPRELLADDADDHRLALGREMP